MLEGKIREGPFFYVSILKNNSVLRECIQSENFMFSTAAPLWVCLFFLHLSSKWDSWKKPCLGFIRAMMRACQLFWAAISKGASYQGRQNLRGKGGFSPPPPDFGRIRYCIDCPLRFSDLPPALLIIIYVWHWNIAISSKKCMTYYTQKIC